jgi:hypothetical protein
MNRRISRLPTTRESDLWAHSRGHQVLGFARSCRHALNSIYALRFPNSPAVVPTCLLGFDDDARRGASMAKDLRFIAAGTLLLQVVEE